MKIPLLIIAGPTGIGKTRVAIETAEQLNGEIVGVDSMQIYRYMDIGTAKPSSDERARIPHHLLDIRNPDEDFSVADYVAEATMVIRDIHERGKLPLLVGGTGLYIEKLLFGIFEGPERDEAFRQEMRALAERFGVSAVHEKLQRCDPESAERLHPNDLLRVIRALEVFHVSGLPMSVQQKEATKPIAHYHTAFFVLNAEREAVYRRINRRVDLMVAEGFVEEVQGLYRRGYGPELRPMKSLGYKEMGTFLAGECDLPTAIELMKRNTRRYAKRQLVWFRKYDDVQWITCGLEEGTENGTGPCSEVIRQAWIDYNSGSEASVSSS